MKDSVIQNIEKRNDDQNKLIKIKTDLIEQEYKDNLEEQLKIRLDNLAEELSNVKGAPSIIEIKNLMTCKYTGTSGLKYNNTELTLVFEYFKEFVTKINKVTSYVPTKQSFCGFIGVSTSVYNNWRVSEDHERREIMQQIEDYITDIMLSSAQKGEVREISTMFRTKTEHGYVETQAPIVIEHKNETDINNIMRQIEAVNKGRSLKDIELDKSQYDIQ